MLPDASSAGKKTEKEKTGLFSRFLKSESAAATVIIAILLLGLVFTMISIIKLEYVPEWKNDAEQNQAYEIWDSMAGLKVRIDILSRLMESSNYSTNSLSATIPFNTGGGEIPVFEPSKSNGKLELNTERCKLTITPYNSTNQTGTSYFRECGGISCFSGNRQYPDQVFRYENGALILADSKSSTMKQFPVLAIEENETKNGNCTVSIRAVRILGEPNSISSNTIIPLRVTGWEAMPIYDSMNDNVSINAFNLTIATKNPEAWYVYFNETAQEKGLEYEKDYTVKLDSNSVRFYFLPNGSKTLERLYVSESIISAEIIPLRYRNVMKLNQWYSFDTASDPTIELYRLSDCGSPVNLSVQNITDQVLSGYTESSYVTHDLKNNPFDSTFGFDSFTEFESQPNSAKILIIYRLPDINNPSYMSFAGNSLNPALTEGNGNKWYLYTRTIPATSINDPSDLDFYLRIDAETGKKVDIDYLAVYLS
ncbi:hypothetical protein FXW07_04320 [Methanosarcina sp. DH1]|uniref:hypothetical protein n=1 Tax=Methanosarcina sp. DH1 TaxID=2605695 RepID=UPI001E4F4EDF|nr:hypothetical protein [Methanosarcina sp. DH1]MCC4765866.1 hypothetical protein [Methanosarcina sp. DH1]